MRNQYVPTRIHGSDALESVAQHLPNLRHVSAEAQAQEADRVPGGQKRYPQNAVRYAAFHTRIGVIGCVRFLKAER